uniref:Uncharacterized protein n=1 Tax=Sphondylothamnion multifidum TaxID=193186 RepID=A0A4D6WYF3_9FLOR|nr:hypothetical protein [Sphondylothamnion multifidum]
MIKYWPDKPGIKLNNAVVNLFVATHQKLKQNLYNKTYHYLYSDILDDVTKYKLLSTILKELEILILDITELNIDINEINKLQNKILYNFINTSCKAFIKTIQKSCININEIEKHTYRDILIDENLLIQPLLIYLIFGSSNINNTVFIFNTKKTPTEHVIIIFENFIIQVSNSIIYKILNQFKSIEKITYFLKKNNLCNSNYLSARSIILIMNQLIWQNFLQEYLYQPKAIYSARYQVWLISSKGLITKYIYLLRLDTLLTLSIGKSSILLFIEILDIIIPKIEKLLLNISKYLLYITMNIFGNSILLIIRALINYLNH